MSFAHLTAGDIAQKVRTKEMTAQAVTTAYLDRIRVLDPKVKAFNEVFADHAISQAKAVDAQPALNRSATLPPGMVGVNSSFFIVRGVVRYDRVEAQTETLMQRLSDKVEIVWQQRS